MTNSNDLIWEDPSQASPRGQKGKWKPILDALRARPGEWAVVGTDVSTSTLRALKNGQLGGAAPGEFEATLRGTRNGRAEKLYARYVGGEQ